MQRPKDTSDFTQCVKSGPKMTRIFCVECDGWKTVEVRATALVTLNVVGIKGLDLNDGSARFLCRGCLVADVGYLLTDDDQATILNQLQENARG